MMEFLVTMTVEPGEWRTLGLFSGENGEQLEKTLASSPLRVWRRDEVPPLAPDPNDPGAGASGTAGPTSGVLHCLHVPQDASPDEVRAVTAREAVRPGELADQGAARTAVAAAGRGGAAPGAGLVAGRRSAADARHSGLTAEVELDDGADDAVGGASERPCCDLNELTTDALRQAVPMIKWFRRSAKRQRDAEADAAHPTRSSPIHLRCAGEPQESHS